MTIHNINLYFNTLKHLRPTQLYHQVYYRLFTKSSVSKSEKSFKVTENLEFTNGADAYTTFFSPRRFGFLNLEKSFDESSSSPQHKIDWNFSEYGKLWTYNLNYFEFLHQSNLSKEEGLELINEFCASKDTHQDGYEPYPISLRGVNWVKFLSKYHINEPAINQQLYDDYLRLCGLLEYQHLGNHLFENGFSLLFGAYYFQDEDFYKIALKILKSELHEQILADGANYELSPMYHCIILSRILDCYNLVSQNSWKDRELADLLKDRASLMLGWLKAIQFSNGDLPMVNDSAPDIAPTPEALFVYAHRLNINETPVILKESGYRKFQVDKLEVLIDVGQISPSYQPAHSHADSLQILLHSEGQPIIVDTGISTYEKNERRQLERSTCSHNTVTVDNLNSSKVWSGFRVAQRATVSILEETDNRILASHNGYRDVGVLCKRELKTLNNAIEITDNVSGSKPAHSIEGHLHLHPDVNYEVRQSAVILNGTIEVLFPEETKIELVDYMYCQGYNQLVPSKKIKYRFDNEITFTIK